MPFLPALWHVPRSEIVLLSGVRYVDQAPENGISSYPFMDCSLNKRVRPDWLLHSGLGQFQ